MWNDDRDDCETIVDGCDLLWAVVIFCCRLLSFVGDFGRLWGDCGRLFAIGFFIMVFGGGGNAQNFTADPMGVPALLEHSPAWSWVFSSFFFPLISLKKVDGWGF